MKTIKINAEDERSLRDGVVALEDLTEVVKVIMRKLPGEPVQEL